MTGPFIFGDCYFHGTLPSELGRLDKVLES